jgi:redox-sensitive bicupin YhaK (pirin superfamily)
MSVQFTKLIASLASGKGSTFSVQSIDLDELGERASPIAVLDQFRVRSRPFPPHPHAGFSAVTYVLEDSVGSLRSRDSLGNDVVMGPGGIVLTQTGSGVMHEEVPADPDRELHGLQIFVNLSSKNKLVAPQMFRLDKSKMPEWRSDAGDRVRVVVGSFEGLSSPLVPVEPFTFLDVQLQHQISFNLENAHNALIYVLKGNILARATGRQQQVPAEHALGLHGGGRVTFEGSRPAHFVILSGAEIREPVVAHGPFIMNKRSQITDAVARYQAGKMGRLSPLSNN